VLLYLGRRLVWAVLLAFVVAVITFVVFFVLPTTIHNRTNDRGLDIHAQFQADGGSTVSQFLHFLHHVVIQGDLGESTSQGIPVTAVVFERLPVTFSLVLGGVLIWLLIAFPIGILSALHPRSLLDKGSMVFVLIGASAHSVWVSLLLSYIFGVRLHAFPIAGYCDFHHHVNSENGCWGAGFWAYHMVLPWVAFSLVFAALYARMIRASLLEVLEEDYIRTARAKGASEARVVRNHALRNALLPVVTMLGMDVGIAFGGAIFIESVFDLPGIGRLFYQSIIFGDVPVIMGIALLISFVVVIANLIVDVLYAFIDPRVGMSGAGSASLVPGPKRASRRRRRAQAAATESAT
jgi:peptide/nickel transport system permease protein